MSKWHSFKRYEPDPSRAHVYKGPTTVCGFIAPMIRETRKAEQPPLELCPRCKGQAVTPPRGFIRWLGRDGRYTHWHHVVGRAVP